MKRIRNIPWPRVLAEGVVIVVSILLAFGIDAWWDERQDQISEKELLAQIYAESVANRDLFAAYKQNHQNVFDAGIRLLDRTGPQVSLDNEETNLVNIDLGIFSDWWTVQPSIGVISTTLHSGQLNLIESNDLRSELAAWESILEDLRDNEQIVVRLSDGVLGEYWYDNAPYRSVFRDKEIGESKFKFDVETILRDRRFESLVYNKVHSERTILERYEAIQESTDRLIQLASGSLGKE